MFTPGGQPELHHTAAYGGKGGGSSPVYQPPPPTVLTDPISGKSFMGNDAAAQLNAEIDARTAGEKTASDKAAADKAAADAAAESTFQGRRQSAYDTALQNVMRSFTLQGADPQQYLASDITPALQRQFNSIQDLDPNPSAAFPTTLGDTILSNVLSGKRTQAQNQFNALFPSTYAETAIPDALTGQYKSQILDEQFNPLSAQLQTAQKRGTLTGAGYQAALDALAQKRSAADAAVSTLGQGIVSADRSGLNDYLGGARTNISNLSLADQFDPGIYSSGATSRANQALQGFGGQLRSAVGDTKYADITDLLNAGGAVQGAQNPNAANPTGVPTTAIGGGPLSPNYISPEDAAKLKRGLGSTGAF